MHVPNLTSFDEIQEGAILPYPPPKKKKSETN